MGVITVGEFRAMIEFDEELDFCKEEGIEPILQLIEKFKP